MPSRRRAALPRSPSNGAAARLVQKGDKVIIVAYCQIPAEEARNYRPTVVVLGEGNEVVAHAVSGSVARSASTKSEWIGLVGPMRMGLPAAPPRHPSP